MYEEMDLLFTLYIRLADKDHGNARLSVRAYDANHTDPRTGHQRIDVDATLYETVNGRRITRVIFGRGDTWCAVPRRTTLDGNDARELVLSLLAMKPGDTDAGYFEHYTPEQLEFAERFGEELWCERQRRYCDEDGSVR